MPQSSFLYREIHEQPAVLERLLSAERETARQLAEAIHERGVTHVVIAARGTSDNAGRYAKYLFGAKNDLTVALATPSLFTVYQEPPRLDGALVLGISQSGKSPDIVAVLAEARRQGVLTAAITNFPDSDLGRQADFVLELNAGLERSIAATKTYTGELAAIALLSAMMAGREEMQMELARIPRIVAATLELEPEVARISARYRYMRDCVVIGRGYNYATAFELALKLKELTYTMAEPYSSADFLHGPLALIEHGFPAVVFAPRGKMLPSIREFMETLRERGAEIIAVSDDAEALALAHVPLELPRTVPEWLSPLTAIIPGQLFALHLAQDRGYDPDHPRALRKVTETR